MKKTAHLIPILPSVRNCLCGRIQAAQANLSGRSITDAAVHAARKHLKASRAGLRLLRGTIGERRYSIENARLRDAARPLSELRDSKVLLETAAALLKTYKNPTCRALLLDLTRMVRRERKKVRMEMLPKSRTLETVRLKLAESQVTLSSLPLDREKSALASDFGRIYRQSRKAILRAREELTDDALHEARKKVKYLANALEMLKIGGARNTEQSIELAKVIGDQLGADRDLAMILSRVKMLPDAKLEAGQALCAQIEGQRKKLQCAALRDGKRLYRAKARAFVKGLSLF